MKISKDWTYKKKDFSVELDSIEALNPSSTILKDAVDALLLKYPYLEGLDCDSYEIVEETDNSHGYVTFSFFIDYIDEIREEQPHLFV